MARKPFVQKLSGEERAMADDFEKKIDAEIDLMPGAIVEVHLHPGKNLVRKVFLELNRRYRKAGWFAITTRAGVVFLFATSNDFYHHICLRAQQDAKAAREWGQGSSYPAERPDRTYPPG